MIKKDSLEEIQNYLVDASNYKGKCSAVYFPENKDEISSLLKEANKDKTPVTISGNGTGLTGGRVPESGIVISTEKLNKIIAINTEEMYAVVEPAVILAEIQAAVKDNLLMYPPDPTERNCFIGGTIATNASGEKTFKYGPTRNYVSELEIVLADGEILYLTRGKEKAEGRNLKLITISGKTIEFKLPDYKMPEVKNASGYFCKENMDAIDLFIGSEGTLGLITKAKLRLVDLPENIISCVIFFDNEQNALDFISRARDISRESNSNQEHGAIEALALEFFDDRSLKFLQDDYPQIPRNVKAGVWFEQEVTTENEETFFESWMDLIKEFHGDEDSAWFAFNEADKKRIQEFRHFISAKIHEYIAQKNLKNLGTDVAVPDKNFYELYFSSKKKVEEAGIDFVTYGHFGNSHVHLNMLPKDQAEYDKGMTVYNEICNTAIRLGGTISAEHGIGKKKRDYLLAMYGKDVIEQMKLLKKVFDPNMILGRGNIFYYED